MPTREIVLQASASRHAELRRLWVRRIISGPANPNGTTTMRPLKTAVLVVYRFEAGLRFPHNEVFLDSLPVGVVVILVWR